MQYIMDNVNLFFSEKKCMPAINGAETEHTAGYPAHNATKSNFENLYKWHDEQIELFTVSELNAIKRSFAEKRPKCLLFKMN